MKRVSIINLTLDRYSVTRQCLTETMDRIEYPNVEWLAWDNGSSDDRVKGLLREMEPDYLRLYPENIGICRAKNQLLIRATGDYLVSIDPDIIYPERWVTRLVEAAEAIPDTGLSGYYPGVGGDPDPPTMINGVRIRPKNLVTFGGYFFPRALLEEIGYLYEGYGLYAHEERDLGVRVRTTGRRVYYMAGARSYHKGHRGREPEWYTNMKLEQRKKHVGRKGWRIRGINMGEISPYVPPPEEI
jgi:GT2 family glycosyltransferase